MNFLRNIFFAPLNPYHFPLIASGVVTSATYFGERLIFTPDRIASSQFLQWLPFISGLMTCVAGYALILRVMPTRDIGATVPFHGPYNVAVKDYDLSSKHNHPTFLDKDGKPRRCPGAAIYYPTTSKPSETDSSKWPSWCPFNDEQYAYGFSFYVSLPKYMFGHFITAKIKAMNANDPEQVKQIQLPENFQKELGSKKFPIVLFAHGLAGHSRAYTTYACELASQGAIVIAPTFTDGSAIYSRSHADKALWPGPAHSKLDDNDIHTPPPTSPNVTGSEKSFEVIYVMPPPEGNEVQNQARNDFRMKQIKHRVTEIEEWRAAVESNFSSSSSSSPSNTTVLKWLFENTNTSFSASAFEQITKEFQNQDKMVYYMGHSFGASTALIASVERNLKNSTTQNSSIKKQLPPTILLDLWWLLPELRFGMNSGVFKGTVPTSQIAGYRTEDSKNGKEFVDPTNLPDLCVIDSALWTNPKHDSRPYFNFLKSEWPKKFQEHGISKTDHIAVSDLGIFSPVVSRSKSIVKYDEFTADEVPAIQAKVAWKAISEGV